MFAEDFAPIEFVRPQPNEMANLPWGIRDSAAAPTETELVAMSFTDPDDGTAGNDPDPGDDTIIVTGERITIDVLADLGLTFADLYPRQPLDDSFPDIGGGGSFQTSQDPACDLTNQSSITGANGTVYSGLDGARYYVPEEIDGNYINAAAAFLIDLASNGVPGDVTAALWDMYTDPTHPHFLDFKEYGTATMPDTVNAGTQTYFSEAAGAYVETSWFEPFGNVLYGYMLTIAGYAPEEIWAIAAILQEGNENWIPSDDPQDQPHVDLGISMAQQYLLNGQSYSPIDIDEGSC